MPTALGKPKVGERIRFTPWDGRNDAQPIEGKVIERTPGEYYSLHVLYDGQAKPTWLLEASYFMVKGRIKILGRR